MHARILLVEDDQSLAEMFALLPRLAGHEVTIARDGDEALEIAEEAAPDLLLLDVRLPRRSGLDVLEALRGRGFTGAAWMLTSYSQQLMIARALAAGASRWLVKSSITPREMTAHINEWAVANLSDPREPEAVRDARNRANAPILVADDRATYVALNPAAARLLEANPSEVVGRQVWDFTPGAHVPFAEELWRRFVSEGAASGPYLVTTRTGRQVRVHYEAFANVSRGLHVSVLEPEEPLEA